MSQEPQTKQADLLTQEIERLRADIEARGFDPDKPKQWAWDPWPERDNAEAFRGRAQGEGSAPCFLNPEAPFRLLEAHLVWDKGGAQQRLLVLPRDAQGRLHWQWHPPVNPDEAAR